ncbi:MAG: hypothetical protein QWI73_03715 [Alphaproteobacteria bacterium]|nr:hypothetical protein [Alphaproteobacteria bacterium]
MKLSRNSTFCKLNVTGKWRDNNDDSNDDDDEAEDDCVCGHLGDWASAHAGVIAITILAAICIGALLHANNSSRGGGRSMHGCCCWLLWSLRSVALSLGIACPASIKPGAISPSLYTLCYMLISE